VIVGKAIAIGMLVMRTGGWGRRGRVGGGGHPHVASISLAAHLDVAEAVRQGVWPDKVDADLALVNLCAAFHRRRENWRQAKGGDYCVSVHVHVHV